MPAAFGQVARPTPARQRERAVRAVGHDGWRPPGWRATVRPSDDLVELLDGWARDRALLRTVRPNANTSYALDRTLLPTIVAFSLAR